MVRDLGLKVRFNNHDLGRAKARILAWCVGTRAHYPIKRGTVEAILDDFIALLRGENLAEDPRAKR